MTEHRNVLYRPRYKIPPNRAWPLLCDLRRARVAADEHGAQWSAMETCRALAQGARVPAIRIYNGLWRMQTDIVVSCPVAGVRFIRLWDYLGYRVAADTSEGWLWLSRRQLADCQLATHYPDRASDIYARYQLFGVAPGEIDKMINGNPMDLRY